MAETAHARLGRKACLPHQWHCFSSAWTVITITSYRAKKLIMVLISNGAPWRGLIGYINLRCRCQIGQLRPLAT